MPILRQTLTEIVSGAFSKCGYDAGLGMVTMSDRADLCQYQCNGALSAAKIYKKNPAIIAKDIVSKLESKDCFKSVQFAPPGFINITLNDEYLAKVMQDMSEDSRLGLPYAPQKKTVVIDYGGPNVAKPLHVGHLRTAIIGESIKRLARFMGYDVIGDVHLGDWGLQMGMIIAELELRQPELPYFDENYTGEYDKNPPVTIDDLNNLYPDASKRAKTDEDFKKKAQKATSDLQNGRRGYRALWRHFLDVSIADLKKSYEKLNVSFDKWLGESDADPFVNGMLKALEEKKLSYISEGALVVDVALPEDDEAIPPIIISKTDGSQLYGTTDIATIIQRVKDFDPDEMWYVVDSRQAMHFKQVFRCCKRAGFVRDDVNLEHVGFGTMNGKDGKPYKTRDGGVMPLSELIGTVTEAARKKLDESELLADNSEAEKMAIAEKVGIAALKFGDLINHRTKDYVFDIERFLSSEGKTGPYLQYSAVRISSVLRKAEQAGAEFGKILPAESETERTLMLKLTNVGDVLFRALDEKAPNGICEILFDIAGAFNRFYYENKIITCPDHDRRGSWLSLIKLTRDMVALLLDILATEVPEKM